MAREIDEKNYHNSSRMCCLPLSRLFSSISHKKDSPNSRLLASISPQRDCPDLNDEMIEEILGRLPLSSLLRAKTVCKAWNTAISSRNFNAHEDRGINNQYFVAQVDDENVALFSIALNRGFQIPLFTTTDGLGRRVCAAEAEGLYLFVVWKNYKDSMIIVNPATKQQRLLPPLPNKWNKMAVELVAHSDHIEIIAFGFDKREPLYLCALIYNSFTNKWKNVPLMRDAVHFTSRHGIYIRRDERATQRCGLHCDFLWYSSCSV